MLFGTLLKTLRRKTGHTSQQLADALHVSRSTYSRYENNMKCVENDVLISIAEFYKTTVDDIIIWNSYVNKPDYPYNIYELINKNKSIK